MKYHDNNIGKLQVLAHSDTLVLISRLSAPILVGLCTWILSTVVQIKVDNAGMQSQIAGLDRRTTILEDWRNYFIGDANASGVHRR